jgi:hypothetical protein
MRRIRDERASGGARSRMPSHNSTARATTAGGSSDEFDELVPSDGTPNLARSGSDSVDARPPGVLGFSDWVGPRGTKSKLTTDRLRLRRRLRRAFSELRSEGAVDAAVATAAAVGAAAAAVGAAVVVIGAAAAVISGVVQPYNSSPLAAAVARRILS